MYVPGCLNGEKDQSRTDYCVTVISMGPQVAPSEHPAAFESDAASPTPVITPSATLTELSASPSSFPSTASSTAEGE